MKEILEQNKKSWDTIADDWFGTTSLPVYGKKTPLESELNLFGDVVGKTVLDIGCGSGHSLRYIASKGAGELWGLDLSDKQLQNADDFLRSEGVAAKLFQSPMEQNPGLPLGYFDVVYSIYALGWTQDLDQTLSLVSSYLKPGGSFIFSWDHPLMKCVSEREGALDFEGSYHEEDTFAFSKGNQPLTLINRKMSTYVNTLAKHGLVVEQLIEDVDTSDTCEELAFSSAYYSQVKANRIPLSFVLKAKKINVAPQKHKTEVSMFNMCMICNDHTGEVVIQEKVNSDWQGLTFPGGKVEPGEGFIASTIREVHEETGLIVKNLKPAGTINWYNTENGERWLVFLYKTNDFAGDLLHETSEGKVYWSKLNDVNTSRLAPNMETYLKLFQNDHINEAYATWNSQGQSQFTII